MAGCVQHDFLSAKDKTGGLPADDTPAAAPHFHPDTIVLTKGSLATKARETFVHRICQLYPHARTEERLNVPHNRLDLHESDIVALHRKGKRTLVFGELKNAVRFSDETGNTCPNYWHFSVYGYCFYGCKYCYLSGTRGIWFSPTVKIYVNLPEIISEIDRVARRLGKPTAFYLGKLQDGLALDPLTAYSTVLVPFFARHVHARQVILTKSASVERLLDLDHRAHTIVSWSLNPQEISERFEENTPPVAEKILAMKKCADRGYPIRAVVMPIIAWDGWEKIYEEFLRNLLSRVTLERLTLGGICSYPNALALMERRLDLDNVISRNLAERGSSGDGRRRYSPELRARLYQHLIAVARSVQPHLDIALCLEERSIWATLDLPVGRLRCNCVW